MEIKEIFNLGELFEAVQMHQIFPDGKTFVDCEPKFPFTVIYDRYEVEKQKKDFDLSEFVLKHFSLPKEHSVKFVSDKTQPVARHIEMLWDELVRQPDKAAGSLIPLPYSYVVPGGRFREIYYWDSYFTMLGLKISKRNDLIENMINNFSFLIDQFGYIPNGNRTYYLGRSQPPYYSCMVKLLNDVKEKEPRENAEKVLVKYLPQLKKEYDFWMKGIEHLSQPENSTRRVILLKDGNVLNHYWDENDTPRPESFKEDVELSKKVSNRKALYRHLRAAAESGWDFSSRWFSNGKDISTIHTTEIIPVDLNCLLYHLEKTIAEASKLKNDKEDVLKFENAMLKRKKAINEYCWNSKKRFYFDYDYVADEQNTIFSLAAAYPLFFEIASKEQAAGVAETLEQRFLRAGGLITTAETTMQQWDAPNGWAPLHWITICGLKNYGHDQLAKEITKRWLTINEKVYRDTGKMMEKYNVVITNTEAGGGEYPTQDGFGWTNGVYLALCKWAQK